MREQFIPFEQALQLKELGFDEKCFGWWSYVNGNIATYFDYQCSNSELTSLNTFSKNCTAPLWQQAFYFFRINFNLEILFREDSFNKGLREYVIISTDKSIVLEEYVDQKYWIRKGCFKTYEEARLECLKHLIKLL